MLSFRENSCSNFHKNPWEVKNKMLSSCSQERNRASQATSLSIDDHIHTTTFLPLSSLINWSIFHQNLVHWLWGHCISTLTLCSHPCSGTIRRNMKRRKTNTHPFWTLPATSERRKWQISSVMWVVLNAINMALSCLNNNYLNKDRKWEAETSFPAARILLTGW